MHRLQMRTMLLIALLTLSFGLAATSLLVIRVTVGHQIQANLASDLEHSVQTFLNLQRQRREMLSREAALLADLPSLKALMTTQDRSTIADGGVEFWKTSGRDLFALTDPDGHLIVHYDRAALLDRTRVQLAVQHCIERPFDAHTLAIGDTIYEMVAQPLAFGPNTSGTALGFVVIGYAIDQRLAREVSQAAAAEVAFSVDRRIVLTTLTPALEDQLRAADPTFNQRQAGNQQLHLGAQRYLASSIQITPASDTSGTVLLTVLKSYDEASQFLTRVNQWVLGLSVLALLLGSLIAVFISRTVTRPLEALVDGTRALGRGDFNYQLSSGGTAEIRELRQAFDRMRVELRQSQRNLVDAERLATIGRMASSISHDLRHHLSAMYANAEFLSLANTPQPERDLLILEVQAAVHEMTDLLDSLLLFSQTGNPLHPTFESINFLVERAASIVRSHPDARGVELVLHETSSDEAATSIDAWVDAPKLHRAVFNLLLNACQAARRSESPPLVELELLDSPEAITIRIADSGAGVPDSIRKIVFQPFVSKGKENGTGLGLTLAQHIAQEHGGSVVLEASRPGRTVFAILLPRQALASLQPRADQPATHTLHH